MTTMMMSMMKRITPFAFLVVSFATALSPFAFAEKVPVKAKFTTAIESPSVITACENALWAYSTQTRNVIRINPESGAVQSMTPATALKIDGNVIAIGCSTKKLLIAAQKRGDSNRTYSLTVVPIADGKLGAGRSVKLPGSGPIRDLFCRPHTQICYAIRDQIFRTYDLVSWQEASIPRSRGVPSSEVNTEENPFAGWQDQFIIASGQYFRGSVLDTKLFLLDPLRSSVVSVDLKSNQDQKWGRWGVWEGRLMSPKGMAPLDGYFAISDVGLKLVFIFTPEGKYIGSIGADGGAARFNYPLDIAAIGKSLYVADFGGNKVYGFDTNPAATPPLKPSSKLEDVIRQNLFRDPTVLKARARTRCLSCHDGLQINSLDKFMEHGKHHPINVEMKPGIKIDLPLDAGRLVTCSTCHDAHHGVAEGPITPKSQHRPHMLRKPVRELCLTCHTTKAQPEFTHVAMNPSEACAECHSMHVSQDYLLKEKIPSLCVGCHGKEKIPTTHPFSPDMVTCVSCHSLHDASPKLSLATHSKFSITGKGEPQATCFVCHEDKKALVGKSIHLGPESQMPHPWPKDEAMCLDCHDPHGKKKPVVTICNQCHDIHSTHPVPVPISDTNIAKNIKLDHDHVTCVTCHEPHGGTPPNEHGRSFFRPDNQITVFCSGCHGDDATTMYKEFHQRRKK